MQQDTLFRLRVLQGLQLGQDTSEQVCQGLTPLDVMRSIEGLTLRTVTPRECMDFSTDSTPQNILKESAGRTVEPLRTKYAARVEACALTPWRYPAHSQSAISRPPG